MLSLDRVYKASTVLKEVIRETDMISAPKLNKSCNVYLKTENLQVTGSFKIRGSYFKISQLTDEEKKKGVIACSAGNHAQGVALAATKNGIKSIICLPDGAPISKVEATKRYGAEVCLVKGVYDDAYKKAIELKNEKGLMTLMSSQVKEQSVLKYLHSYRLRMLWLYLSVAAGSSAESRTQSRN